MSIDGLKFKEACGNDLDPILAIENRVHLSPWTRLQVSQSLETDHLVWLAMSENILAGYIFVMPALDQWELINLAVDKPWQGRGLGGQCLGHIIREAQTNHIESIFLEVRSKNTAAIHLYEKKGFTQVGCRRNYYCGQGTMDDALVMQLITR